MFDLVCNFDVPADSPLRNAGNALDALRPYAEWLGVRDLALQRWWLGADTREEAELYEEFAEGWNGHTAAKAAVNEEYRNSRAPVVYLWNGHEDPKTGASLVLSVTEKTDLSHIELALSGSPTKPRAGLGDYKTVAELVAMLACDTSADCCFVYRQSIYFHRMPFKDRPGVGWMLYLPRVFTPAELPEARALVPVMRGKTQMGTIIVSVTDGVFDARNDEHVKVAQAIEVRLVGNDWLPTWAQMTRPPPSASQP